MQAEAQPFIDHYGVKEVKDFFAPLPCKLYTAELAPATKGANATDAVVLNIVLNGLQHGSNLVGCEAASVATLAAIQRLNPDVVVNSGTCGAFKSDGAEIGDVFIGNAVMFHDRRVAGDDQWGTQTLGNYPVYGRAEDMAKALGFKVGKVTTGSSLDMQPCDLEIIKANGGQLKDMEGAAVAFVCSLFKVPILFVKSVTDLCDSGAETLEDFSRNLATACETLRRANIKVIDYLSKS